MEYAEERWRRVGVEHPTRVVIVGAGIAGLSAAHFLRARGHEHVTVIERLPSVPSSGHTVVADSFACQLLSAAGVDLAAAAVHGGMQPSVDDTLLYRHKIYEQLSKGLPPKTVRYGRPFEKHCLSDNELLLRDGETIPFDVLVFADGRNSVGHSLVDQGNSPEPSEVIVAQAVGPARLTPTDEQKLNWNPDGVDVAAFELGGGRKEVYMVLHRPQADVVAVAGRGQTGGFTPAKPIARQWFEDALRELDSPWAPFFKQAETLSFVSPARMRIPERAVYPFAGGAAVLIGDAHYQPWFWSRSGTSKAIIDAHKMAQVLPLDLCGNAYEALSEGDLEWLEMEMWNVAQSRSDDTAYEALTMYGYSNVKSPLFGLARDSI
jgi:2-polyprenyl-6-methoxyphenol hydroxylase-like FAD-dependent oxidoreductase